jgi:hypothetical protein
MNGEEVKITIRGLTKFIDIFVFKKLINFKITSIRESFISDNLITMVIDVDHSKLWKNSDNFNKDYSNIILNLDKDGSGFDEELSQASRHFGMFDVYLEFIYEHSNLDVYEPLLDYLGTKGFDFSVETYGYNPMVNIIIQNNFIFDDKSLEEDGFNTDTIVFKHR